MLSYRIPSHLTQLGYIRKRKKYKTTQRAALVVIIAHMSLVRKV